MKLFSFRFRPMVPMQDEVWGAVFARDLEEAEKKIVESRASELSLLRSLIREGKRDWTAYDVRVEVYPNFSNLLISADGVGVLS